MYYSNNSVFGGRPCRPRNDKPTWSGNAVVAPLWGVSWGHPNEERTKNGLRVVSSQPMQITLRNRLVLQFVRYKPVVCQNVKIKLVDYAVTVEVGTEQFCSCGIV